MWAKGKRVRLSRLAQDAYFYITCKGLVKVLECSISETAAHSLGPVAMREWRTLEPRTGSDHEYGVQCILLDDRGSSSMCSSPTVQRMTVEFLIGWSSGKPLMIFAGNGDAAWPSMATFSFQHLRSTLHLAMLTYTAHNILDST